MYIPYFPTIIFPLLPFPTTKLLILQAKSPVGSRIVGFASITIKGVGYNNTTRASILLLLLPQGAVLLPESQLLRAGTTSFTISICTSKVVGTTIEQGLRWHYWHCCFAGFSIVITVLLVILLILND